MREVLVEHIMANGRSVNVHIFAAVSISDRDLVRGQALEHTLKQAPSLMSLEALKSFRESLASLKTVNFTSITLAEGVIEYKYVREGGRTWEHLKTECANEATILFVTGPNSIGKATLELAHPIKADIKQTDE